jgi:hypothetical protein
MKVLNDRVVRRGGGNFVYLSLPSNPQPRVGIYLKGGCDLASVFVLAPLLTEELSGTCCLYSQGIGISDSRPDIILQSRSQLAEEVLRDVLATSDDTTDATERPAGSRLGLPLEYFRPVLFEPTFAVPGQDDLGQFPKTLVALSIGPAVARSAYRHRQHGYLVDPGGFWLNESMDKFLDNVEVARWFKRNFESVGKMTVADFHDTFGEVVRLIKQETGAQVLVFNTLVVDPGSSLHNYQFARNSPVLRRRQFDMALRELSNQLDFAILDVDRILKLSNVKKQIEFAHFPLEHMKPIAEEVHRILRELSVL